MSTKLSLLSEEQKKLYAFINASGLFDVDYYFFKYPDIQAAGMDALEHFIVAGDAEGREPNQFFRPNWYRPQVGPSVNIVNALAHYIIVGDKNNLQPFPGFDPVYVKGQVQRKDATALHSFIEAKTFKIDLNPNELFDYKYYLAAHPDLIDLQIDAYIHFVDYGIKEGRTPSAKFSWAYLKEKFNITGDNEAIYSTVMLNWRRANWAANKNEPTVKLIFDEVRKNHQDSVAYEKSDPVADRTTEVATEIFAFYLPQFHRIEENDKWWGMGFTEWHNVVRGLPRFKGHYQPRIPADLGFYDLETPGVMKRQVEMAKDAGLSGFAFYYYDFGDQRLLEKPLNMFLEDKSLDVGYFLIWANETWSRRWDGSESEILIEQKYPEKFELQLVEGMLPHLNDPRYKKINGRPLVVIYRVSQVKNPPAFVKKLRAEFAKKGQNPLIYMAQSFDDVNPEDFGLDGAMEFPPHKISKGLQLLRPEKSYEIAKQTKIYSYDHFVANSLNEPSTPNLIRTCFPSWDNDGRRQGSSSVVHGSTPKKFEYWLRNLVNSASGPAGTGVVCINAWNEWGEGAYLEPDRRYGHAYLNVIKRVKYPLFQSKLSKMILVGHDAFSAGAQRLLLNIGKALKEEFSREVTFLLLNAGPGYDGLLHQYQAIARTISVNIDDPKAVRKVQRELVSEGYRHAIINTSVASVVIPHLLGEIKSTLLIHELAGMLKKIAPHSSLVANFAKADVVVAPTVGLERVLKKEYQVDPKKLLVQPQGLYRQMRQIDSKANRQRFMAHLGRNDMPKVVCGIGYADYRKGIDIFLQVCSELTKDDPSVVFVWQGNWDDGIRASLSSQITELTTRGALVLVPNADEVEEVLDVADVFFLSSREDPLPSVAFEAWSMGVPVLAFAGTGGIADVIAANPALGLNCKTVSSGAAAKALQSQLKIGSKVADGNDRKNWVAQHSDWSQYVFQLQKSALNIPDVDVCIIGHKHAEFVDSRVSSLLQQTLPAKKVIYFDIGSDADTRESLMSYVANRKKSRLTLENWPTNHGKLFESWEQLAKLSRAEYIHIAEGDDAVEPVFLERLVAGLQGHPNAALAFSGVSWIDSKSELIAGSHVDYVLRMLDIEGFQGGYLSPEQLVHSGLAVTNPILSMSSVVWRRDFLLEVLDFSKNYLKKVSFAYDWILYVAAAKLGYGMYFSPAALAKHRQHSNSMSSVGLKKHMAEISKCHSLFSDLGIFGKEADQASYIRSLKKSM